MLRLTFVGIIVLVGTFYALISPFYALLFYLWHAYFRPEEWIWWIDFTGFRLSLIIGVYVMFRTLFSAPNPRINLGTGLVLLFLAQAVIGTVMSEHPAVSWPFFSDFVKVLLITYVIVVLVTDRDRFRLTLIVIALSLGFECAKQGWATLFLAPGLKNDNKIGFLGDNNGVALGTMMLVPILGALAQTATRKWEKHAFRFVAIGVFLRGLTTYSRGGFLAAGVLALFLIGRSERKLRALIGVALVGALVWSVMPPEYWNRINTITTDESQMDDSAAGRLHFWRIAALMARAKPLTGVGLNGSSASYAIYDPNDKWGEGRATHSTWFGVLADLGFVGFFLFVANLAVAFRSCWRVAQAAKRDPAKRELGIYANALLTSLVVFAVGGSFLSSQYSEMLWHFFGLSTALSVVAVSEVTVKAPVAEPARPIQPYAVAR